MIMKYKYRFCSCQSSFDCWIKFPGIIITSQLEMKPVIFVQYCKLLLWDQTLGCQWWHYLLIGIQDWLQIVLVATMMVVNVVIDETREVLLRTLSKSKYLMGTYLHERSSVKSPPTSKFQFHNYWHSDNCCYY